MGVLGLRQQEMEGTIRVDLHLDSYGEAGLSLYMDCDHHYDLALVRSNSAVSLIKRRVIGDMEFIQQEELLPPDTEHRHKTACKGTQSVILERKLYQTEEIIYEIRIL